METIDRFNIRIYGVLTDSKNRILTSVEQIKGKTYRKFPGGGMEFGEGTLECLKREFLEELNLEVYITKHLYTTDFFVPSAFSETEQIVSIYYLVEALNKEDLENLESLEPETQKLEWIPSHKISQELFNLPIDRHLVQLFFEQKHKQ